MDKNKILKAAQLANYDEGKRNTILKSQSIIFGSYSLGLLFTLIVRLLRHESLNDVLFLVLLGSLGVEIAQVIKKHSLASILTSAVLIVAVIYTAWLVAVGR
ncbi:hypothetical protein EFO90_00025 [Lactiplantibacillus plantarum]|uniref:DUF6442 family protein n=1 Tax=Lactiplantibacillus plantarum TaxID=1590 RepID=UPI0021A79642|nr:DUF6442 family protein [Lactiplantibacillus plantarum]MCT3212791.1 hypothetical protein [Lactiplantibacillus plantarum]MCT3271868.1 hypothetical protein [Lactiplantibacillus plantarum]